MQLKSKEKDGGMKRKPWRRGGTWCPRLLGDQSPASYEGLWPVTFAGDPEPRVRWRRGTEARSAGCVCKRQETTHVMQWQQQLLWVWVLWENSIRLTWTPRSGNSSPPPEWTETLPSTARTSESPNSTSPPPADKTERTSPIRHTSRLITAHHNLLNLTASCQKPYSDANCFSWGRMLISTLQGLVCDFIAVQLQNVGVFLPPPAEKIPPELPTVSDAMILR